MTISGKRFSSRHRVRPLAEVLEGRQLLATITVNTTGDANGADGSETLSLRQAIEISNGTLALSSLTDSQASLVSGSLSSPNTIDFNIPGTGPFVISPTSALPAITSPSIIDGYSQPGSHPNSNGPGQGKNTVLEIELHGIGHDYSAAGLEFDAGASTVRGLAIGGFYVGVEASGKSSPTASIVVQGNFIGTDTTGKVALPNSGLGIAIDSESSTIGGITAGDGNLISGNSGDGLHISAGNGAGTGGLVQGNFIGTDATGTKALPNTAQGIEISRDGSTIGGTSAGAGNVISGNADLGIFLNVAGAALIQGNFIGTDATGTQPIANQRGGIDAFGSSNTIGGTSAGAGNVISGNLGVGLSLDQSSNLVQGNVLGANRTGTKAIPNTRSGIEDLGFSNTIGGTSAGAGNVISGNLMDGIFVDAYEGHSNLSIEGNFIGTDRTGTVAVPNAVDGILLDFGMQVTIGGTNAGAGNVIAFNQGSGIAISQAPAYDLLIDHPFNNNIGNEISRNSIFANGGLGIDLGNDGVSPNSPLGSATSPNLLQPYPVLTSTNVTATGTMIAGTLDAAPSAVFTIEFFANPKPNPSGYGEGKTYLSSIAVTTDASGHASFTFDVGLDLAGQFVSATATDSKGNTSEFARDIAARSQSTTDLLGPGARATLGQPTPFAAVVGATVGGIPTGVVNFLEDGIVIGSAPVEPRGFAGIAVFITRSLSPGPHEITAEYAGDSTHDASLSSPIAVAVYAPHAFGGPSVTSNVFSGPNSVTVTFNRGLYAIPAQDPTNYQIVGPRHHPITVLSAVYQPTNASVTLTTLQKLDPSQSYQLTINGVSGDRIVDVFRIPLNGTPHGRPGHDYVGKIEKAPVVKVVHHSAPKSKLSAAASRRG